MNPTSIFHCIFSLFVYTASARHAHRRPLHRHAARAELTTTVDIAPITAVTAAPLPSFTAGNAVIEDILKIQSGFNELPEDLLAFIVALEQRLAEVEKLLSGYVDNGTGSDSPVGPVGPVLSPKPPAVTEDASIQPSPAPSTPVTAPSASTSLCKPLGGAGPLRPCDEPDATALTTTRSTRITRTNTLMTTITVSVPLATGISRNGSFTAVNGTSFTPPAPWTEPFLASSTVSNDIISTLLPNTDDTSHPSPTAAPSTSSYVFDAESEDNVAVYYGTNVKTADPGLHTLCANPDVDIVILSFLHTFFDESGWPVLDIGGCSGPTPYQASIAPGLQDCSELASQVQTCQQSGKKVLLSLGGYNANTHFKSEVKAQVLADTLWNLFGGGTSIAGELRPFGPDVVLDGFDIDNENHSTTYYEAFAIALREQFASDFSKTYYLSAAPQCPIPDESIPLGVLQQADFIWVQFYNNPSCDLDSPGFRDSFRAWSDLIAEGTSSRGPKPRLYIGVAAFEGAGSGYVKGSGLGTRVRTARGLYVENFGGVMLWDGSSASVNVDQYDVDYLEYAKAALH